MKLTELVVDIYCTLLAAIIWGILYAGVMLPLEILEWFCKALEKKE